jgi:hypothetical protein
VVVAFSEKGGQTVFSLERELGARVKSKSSLPEKQKRHE